MIFLKILRKRYRIFLNKPTDIRKWKFGHRRDYEDIVLHDSTFYIVNNNGDIVSLNFLNDSLITHGYTFPEKGNNEFEALYFDGQLQKLVLICKDCETDKNAIVSFYTFDPRQLAFNISRTLNVKDIIYMARPKSAKFKPSGACVNPVTGELYIISSVNKLLVVADRQGGIKRIYNLDPKVFNHPEGITFTPDGSLFISNEAGDIQPATILFYKFKNGDK